MKITERGWAGHFIAASTCRFRRNTLIENGRKRIVVSTVGANVYDDAIQTIGHERYYETMAFEAMFASPYWDADTSKSVHFNSQWSIDHADFESDAEANEMHDRVVAEIAASLTIKG